MEFDKTPQQLFTSVADLEFENRAINDFNLRKLPSIEPTFSRNLDDTMTTQIFNIDFNNGTIGKTIPMAKIKNEDNE
jgi:hypothetical protein